MSKYNWISKANSSLEVIEGLVLRSKNRHGYKALLSKAAGCQPAYLSQVLKGQTLLTAEHTVALADYLEMSNLETNLFECFVQYDRAGTPLLKQKLANRIQDLKLQLQDEGVFKADKVTNQAPDFFNYYVTWEPSAVHVLAMIPHLQTIKRIAAYLNKSESHTLIILKTLEELGLIRIRGEDIEVSENKVTLHARDRSGFAKSHHRNWRLKGIEHQSEQAETDLFYTSVCSISQSDALLLKTQLKMFIEDSRAVISSSHEEKGYCIGIDLFSF